MTSVKYIRKLSASEINVLGEIWSIFEANEVYDFADDVIGLRFRYTVDNVNALFRTQNWEINVSNSFSWDEEIGGWILTRNTKPSVMSFTPDFTRFENDLLYLKMFFHDYQ